MERIKEIIVKVPVERIVEIEITVEVIKPKFVEREIIEHVDYNII